MPSWTNVHSSGRRQGSRRRPRAASHRPSSRRRSSRPASRSRRLPSPPPSSRERCRRRSARPFTTACAPRFFPCARHIAEIRGLLNQAIRRLERLEGDLLAERPRAARAGGRPGSQAANLGDVSRDPGAPRPGGREAQWRRISPATRPRARPQTGRGLRSGHENAQVRPRGRQGRRGRRQLRRYSLSPVRVRARPRVREYSGRRMDAASSTTTCRRRGSRSTRPSGATPRGCSCTSEQPARSGTARSSNCRGDRAASSRRERHEGGAGSDQDRASRRVKCCCSSLPTKEAASGSPSPRPTRQVKAGVRGASSSSSTLARALAGAAQRGAGWRSTVAAIHHGSGWRPVAVPDRLRGTSRAPPPRRRRAAISAGTARRGSTSSASRSTSASTPSGRLTATTSRSTSCTASATAVRPEAWERIRGCRRVCSPSGRRRCACSRRSRSNGLLHGRTSLFVTPGFGFRRVDALLTNSICRARRLLALVMAFAGVEETRRLYRLAIAERYRFYSFGDAMLDPVSFEGSRRDRRGRPRRGPPHRARRRPDARLHARRHAGDRQGPRPGRGPRRVGSQIILGNTYHLTCAPATNSIARPGRPAPLHGLGPARSSPTPAGSRSSRSRHPQDHRRRRHVPLAHRRRASAAHARAGRRDPAEPRLRHRDVPRRVPAGRRDPRRAQEAVARTTLLGRALHATPPRARPDAVRHRPGRQRTSSCARRSIEEIAALDFPGYALGGFASARAGRDARRDAGRRRSSRATSRAT